jgi:hypothetical protein
MTRLRAGPTTESAVPELTAVLSTDLDPGTIPFRFMKTTLEITLLISTLAEAKPFFETMLGSIAPEMVTIIFALLKARTMAEFFASTFRPRGYKK